MKEGTAISAGNRRKVQARTERKDGFTEAKKQVFLDHLAGCANITHAAKAAGISTVTVNYHRRRDPAFRQQVSEAIDLGYGTLDAALVAHAAHGGRYTPGDTEVPGPGKIDHQIALHLLQLRRNPIGRRTGRAGYEPKRASEKELNEALLGLLDVLGRRLRAKKAPRPGSGQAKKGAPRLRSGRTGGLDDAGR